jgi:uncharacterized protein (TIGR04255 family)
VSNIPAWERSPDLPEYDDPPVTEVALGVLFRPVPTLRAIELSALREQWRDDFPVAQEQPPLPPMAESQVLGAPVVQFSVGPPLLSRLWFLSEDRSRLVQLQIDRLVVNWRQSEPGAKYPRYPTVRGMFERHVRDLNRFISERNFGELVITQVEVNYINSIPVEAGRLGHLEALLRGVETNPVHHLNAPEQARIQMVFPIADLGTPPVRMYVDAAPAAAADGTAVMRFSLTVRGTPSGGRIENAVEFMDGAHAHIVRSFDELTVEQLHTAWGKR